MKPSRKPREARAVVVRAKTYERLATAARRNGEQVGTFLDGILVAFLDQYERRIN